MGRMLGSPREGHVEVAEEVGPLFAMISGSFSDTPSSLCEGQTIQTSLPMNHS